MRGLCDSKISLPRLLCCLALLGVAGCGGYGEVGPRAYQYAQALYTITNLEKAEKLPGVAQQIDAAREAGELSPREAGWLQDIVSAARKGNWATANAQARRIMDAQVR